MKFRKKPVIVNAFPVREAIQCARDNWKGLPKWIQDAYEKGIIIFMNDYVSIQTLEGIHRGDLPDIIIEGVAGELYPCKPDIFEATYEAVNG